MSRGGKRTNAGRKPFIPGKLKDKRFTLRMYQEDYNSIQETIQKKNMTFSDYVVFLHKQYLNEKNDAKESKFNLNNKGVNMFNKNKEIKEKIKRIEEELEEVKKDLFDNKDELKENSEEIAKHIQSFNNQLNDIIKNSPDEKFILEIRKIFETLLPDLRIVLDKIPDHLDLKSIEKIIENDTLIKATDSIKTIIDKLNELSIVFQNITNHRNYYIILNLVQTMNDYKDIFNEYLLTDSDEKRIELDNLLSIIHKKYLNDNLDNEKKSHFYIVSNGDVIFSTPKKFLFYFSREEIIKNFYFSEKKSSWMNKNNKKIILDMATYGFGWYPHLEYLTHFGELIDGMISGLKKNDFCKYNINEMGKYSFIKQSIFGFIKSQNSPEMRYIYSLFYGIYYSNEFSEEDIRYYAIRYIETN